MSKLSKKIFQLSGLLLAVALIVTACKRSFDEPPYISGDPDIQVTHSIRALKNQYSSLTSNQTITDDIIIAGIVTGDDASGNIYKNLIIQDSTGGISIQLDASNLNANYPRGRRVFVKAKGLTIGKYGGLLQLGLGDSNGSPARIPQSSIADYLVAGSTNNLVVPVELTIAQLDTNYLNVLVKLKGVEVSAADTSNTYATVNGTSSTNRTLEDCNDGVIALRSSDFSSFAGIKLPKGKGDVIGIYTTYASGSSAAQNQFTIRDTADMGGLTGARCVVTSYASIAEVRAAYKGGNVAIKAGIVTGVVTSSIANEASANYRITQEDNNAGILLYTGSANAALTLGTKVTLNLAGSTLTSYNGELELTGVTAGNITTSGTGTVTPRAATLAQVKANKASWASTLVTISNVTITGPSSGNYKLKDASGDSVTTYVRDASIGIAEGNATSLTGYVTLYKPSGAADTTVQLTLRTAADVSMTTPPPVNDNISAVYGFGSVVSGSGGTTDPTAVPTATGVTFGSFTANGLGSTAANPNAGGRFSFVNWPTGATNGSNTFTGTVDAAKYYEVTVTVAGGYKLNLDSINLTVQRSGTGVRQWAVRSSIDNYAVNLAASVAGNANLSIAATNVFQVDDAQTSAQAGCTITLGGSSYTSLTGNVTFRFYGFNAEAATGTFSLNKVTFSGKAIKQ